MTCSASCSLTGKLDVDKNRSWTEKDLKATVKVELLNSINNHRRKVLPIPFSPLWPAPSFHLPEKLIYNDLCLQQPPPRKSNFTMKSKSECHTMQCFEALKEGPLCMEFKKSWEYIIGFQYNLGVVRCPGDAVVKIVVFPLTSIS